MNPYLTFGIAMCTVVFLSLGATAWMAVYFNRRAKADLEALLTPLAELLDGTVDLENAKVEGKYLGQIADGAIVTGPAGAGRFFSARIIDAAGGSAWSWLATQPKQAGLPREAGFEADAGALDATLRPELERLTAAMLAGPGWLRFDYDPTAGHVKYTRPMAARRDIPALDVFRTTLDELVKLGALNRSIQETAEP